MTTLRPLPRYRRKKRAFEHRAVCRSASPTGSASARRNEMDDTRFLVAAMAARCRDAIRVSNEEEKDLPKALHPRHLLWMCDQIQKHAHDASVTRLHRWLGFVQAGIL